MTKDKDILSKIKRRELSALIKRISKQDLSALEELYRKTRYAVFGFALSILKNHSKSEDIMQDVFVKILEKSENYKNEGKPMSWIFKITKNLCLMEIRKSRNKDVDIDEFYDIKDETNHHKNMEDKMVLKKMLSILNVQERQIVVMHALSGMKHKEIAEDLDMPISTVLSKYNRSLKKIRGEQNEIN